MAKRDIYGRPFYPDTSGTGVPDTKAEFDAKWRAGVLLEVGSEILVCLSVIGCGLPLYYYIFVCLSVIGCEYAYCHLNYYIARAVHSRSPVFAL